MTVTDRGGNAATSALAASVGLTDADLLAMYRTVALARAVDERMWILNRAGRISFVISGQGHEGAQVGLAWPLRQDHDWVAPYYRSIATCLAFGLTARDLMLAQYAKGADPSSGGRQMPGHYGSPEHHIVSVSSPVATQILHAVGIALAAKTRKIDQVAVAIMGEGSSNQGDVHEALNFAAIHKLPFVFVVENNGYAISVPSEKELSVKDVAARASGYGIPGVIVDGTDVLACYAAGREAIDRAVAYGCEGEQVDGNDVLAVYDATRRAIERARAGGGPTLIEAKVTRLTAHSSDDQETKYRSEDDLAEGRAHDPLPIFREQLRGAGVLTDELEAALNAEIAELVEDATDFAEGEADPDPFTAVDHVYAEAWPSEAPPPWHPSGPGASPAAGAH